MKTSTKTETFDWMAISKKLRQWAPIRIAPKTFRLVFSFYQREATYSLALAALSAYAKGHIPNVKVSLVTATKGDGVDAYVRKVVDLKPDLIALSSMHPTWLPMMPYLDKLKKALPRTPVVVGGYQAIFSPQETLSHPAVDYVCVGDGEMPLVELISRLRGRNHSSPEDKSNGAVPGLWEKLASGQIAKTAPVLTENLEETPFPDYTLFENNGGLRWLSPHVMESKSLTTMPVMCGRGCPYRCSYCSNTALLELFGGPGKLLRRYNPEKFIDELTRLKNRYSVQYFQFMDETFSFDKKYACHLMDLYREQIRLPFSIFARVEQMNDEFCRVAAAAGCHAMWFGVESGSEEYRRRYLDRKMTNRQIVDAAETARKYGIKRMTFNMVGMPHESRENILETLELVKTIRPEYALFSQFLPLPGTPLHKLAEQAGLLLEPREEQQMWTIGDLNIREHAEGIGAGEFKKLVDEIMQYLWNNNVYDDGAPTLKLTPIEV